MKEKIKALKAKIIEGHDKENINAKSLKIAKNRVTKKGARYILLPEEMILKHTNLYICVVDDKVNPVDDKLFFFKVPPEILQVYKKTVNNPKTNELNYVIPHKDLIEVNKDFDQSKIIAKGEVAIVEEEKVKVDSPGEIKKKEAKAKEVVEESAEAVAEIVKAETVEEVKEIVEVNEPVLIEDKKKSKQLMEDASFESMSLRDYAAIHTNKPVSNKAWLNEIIKSK